MNPIWFHAAAWLGGTAFVSLPVALLAGPAWGVALLLVVALALLVYHVRNVAQLYDWARGDELAVPDGGGIWGHLYSALHRRARLAAQDRQQLVHALQRQREALQAMPEGVVILHGANLIESINVVAEDHFGLDSSRDVGMPLANLVRQPDFVAMLERGETTASLLIPSPVTSGHTLSVQLVPFGDERRLVLTRDVTHVERLETMRRDFVANVSHEMRTPLTVVHGYLEMLSDDPASIGSEESQRFIVSALEQSGRMQHLVADLLTLSTLETASPPGSEDRIDVLSLLESVKSEAVTLSAGRHRIAIDAGPGGEIVGNAREVHSALSNLASNAVRYTPAEGRVRITWRIEQGQGLLSVEDDGIGIEARHIPRLTERFYRIDRGRSREAGGTGLGLAIVKHVLERHQARLEIDSTPGEGSCFTMRFPARRVSSGMAPATTPVVSAA